MLGIGVPKCTTRSSKTDCRFCGCEVRWIEQCTKGENKWIVNFIYHDPKSREFKLSGEAMQVQAREFVFLGAGALGTTEILLRSRSRGLGMAPSIGMNMSNNGDVYAFGYNCNEIANAIGKQDPEYLS